MAHNFRIFWTSEEDHKTREAALYCTIEALCGYIADLTATRKDATAIRVFSDAAI